MALGSLVIEPLGTPCNLVPSPPVDKANCDLVKSYFGYYKERKMGTAAYACDNVWDPLMRNEVYRW